MLLKALATGRKWGDKLDPKVAKQTIGGVQCVVREFDAWDGPTEVGETGQFYRFTSVETVGKIRDDRFPKRVANEVSDEG